MCWHKLFESAVNKQHSGVERCALAVLNVDQQSQPSPKAPLRSAWPRLNPCLIRWNSKDGLQTDSNVIQVLVVGLDLDIYANNFGLRNITGVLFGLFRRVWCCELIKEHGWAWRWTEGGSLEIGLVASIDSRTAEHSWSCCNATGNRMYVSIMLRVQRLSLSCRQTCWLFISKKKIQYRGLIANGATFLLLATWAQMLLNRYPVKALCLSRLTTPNR